MKNYKDTPPAADAYRIPDPNEVVPTGTRVQIAELYGEARSLAGVRLHALKPLVGTVVGHCPSPRDTRAPVLCHLVRLDNHGMIYVQDRESGPYYAGSTLGVMLVAPGNFVVLGESDDQAD